MGLLEWREQHQPYELRYWRGQGLRDYSDEAFFAEWWGKVFSWIGRERFLGKKCLDVGSGIRPPLKDLASKLTAIEPLADEHVKVKPEWWEGMEVYSQAAEDSVPELESSFDFCLCWNAIDHGYDWRRSLENIRSYLRPGGVLAISTDCETEPRPDGHPILGATVAEFEVACSDGFMVLKRLEDFADRDICLLLEKL